MSIKKSKGHKAFTQDGKKEWLVFENNLYLAAITNPFDTNDNRVGVWECTVTRAKEYPELYPFMAKKPEHRMHNAPVKMGKGLPLMVKSPMGHGLISIE